MGFSCSVLLQLVPAGMFLCVGVEEDEVMILTKLFSAPEAYNSANLITLALTRVNKTFILISTKNMEFTELHYFLVSMISFCGGLDHFLISITSLFDGSNTFSINQSDGFCSLSLSEGEQI